MLSTYSALFLRSISSTLDNGKNKILCFSWYQSGFYRFTLLKHCILWSLASLDDFCRMRHTFMPKHTSISQQEERNPKHGRLLKCIVIFIMKLLYGILPVQLNNIFFSLLISWRLDLKWLVERTYQKVFMMYGRRYWNCQSQPCFLSYLGTCGSFLNLRIFYGLQVFQKRKAKRERKSTSGSNSSATDFDFLYSLISNR